MSDPGVLRSWQPQPLPLPPGGAEQHVLEQSPRPVPQPQPMPQPQPQLVKQPPQPQPTQSVMQPVQPCGFESSSEQCSKRRADADKASASSELPPPPVCLQPPAPRRRRITGKQAEPASFLAGRPRPMLAPCVRVPPSEGSQVGTGPWRTAAASPDPWGVGGAAASLSCLPAPLWLPRGPMGGASKLPSLALVPLGRRPALAEPRPWLPPLALLREGALFGGELRGRISWV